MGAPFSEAGRRPDDGPSHPVTLTQGFWIGKYEVTQAQWMAVAGTKPWEGRVDVIEAPDRPVVYASRSDIRAWIDRLNSLKRTDAFRMPTEAEWEYAARAGTQTAFSFGDDESRLGTYAWFRGNTIDVGIREAQVVGQKAPNPWGLHDVHGNVREFLDDGLRNYDGRPQTDPRGTNGAPALKGGGFSDLNRELRSASRDNLGGDFATSGFGLRLYMRFDAPEPEEPPRPPKPPQTGVDTLSITTVAGGGIGDGGLATDASITSSGFLGSFASLAVDSQDRIYFLDLSRVRRIESDGTIRTIAGNGRFGFSGDGGPATDATLNLPSGILIDENDQVFIADYLNHRIRTIDSMGRISTIVNSSAFSFQGSFSPADVADRTLIFAPSIDDVNNHLAFGPIDLDRSESGDFLTVTEGRLVRISQSGQTSRLSGRGIFSGIGVSPGRVITFGTVAAPGDDPVFTQVRLPGGIVSAPEGRIYFTQGSQIRWVDSAGTVQIIAGVQTATDDDGVSALFASIFPAELVISPTNDVIVMDLGTNRIRRIDAAGIITTIAGTGDRRSSGDGGPALSARLGGPRAGIYDSRGNLVFHDYDNRRIRMIDTSGIITTVGGGGVSDGGPATDATLSNPVSVAVSDDGTIFVSDNGNQRIRRVDTSGTISTYAGTGESGFSGDGGPATNARLDNPAGVNVDGAGNLYIADRDNNRVRRVSPSGIITTVAGNGEAFGGSGDGGPATDTTVSSPTDVFATEKGTLYISDQGNRRIRRVSPTGTISTVVGNGLLGFSGDGGPGTDAKIGAPAGLVVTADGILYFSDRQNHRIRRLSATGVIATVAGDGNDLFGGDDGPAAAAYLNTPTAVAVDPEGNLLVVDAANDRIRRIDANGIITTYLGTGEPAVPSANGDGGSAAETRLTRPVDIFVTPSGDIYIADSGADRIRKVFAQIAEPPPSAFDPIDPTLADFDNDGSVGFSDFLDFAQAFGSTDSRFDIDESGSVDFGDFLRFASVFGDKTS